MKSKKMLVSVCVVGVILIVGLTNTNGKEKREAASVFSEVTEVKLDVNGKIKETKEYYDKVIFQELNNLAGEKDTDKMVEKLTEVTKKFDEEIEYYLNLGKDESLTENEKEACMKVKTALYGVNNEALKPMLELFSKNSSKMVENYLDIVMQGEEYLKEAIEILN